MYKLLMALCLTFSLNSNSMDLKALEHNIAADYQASLNINNRSLFNDLNRRIFSHFRSIENISFKHPLLKRRLRKLVRKTMDNAFRYNINPIQAHGNVGLDDEGFGPEM